jgi:GT2 family glycosyltransferase/glycosyltransferase involved in cell wall biosynthesis/SAM-dependent methyltransferase
MLPMIEKESYDLGRRPGAPRLIEWTGERCVPWAPDVQVVYEHLHRYLWAAELVKGRRVLDLASGEGFGSAILARSAEAVVGVDVDEHTVEHSRLNYELPNLTFRLADARNLHMLADASFGAVVAFEMIEHVAEQELVLNEIQRVLAPSGLLIISTPDREPYDEAGGCNPFHVHELSREEFVEVLGGRFENVVSFGQRTITGSALTALGRPAEPGSGKSFFIERDGEDWRSASGFAPLYVIAMASNGDLPAAPAESTLADAGVQLVRSLAAQLQERRVTIESQHRELAGLQARIRHDAHTISSLDAALNAANRRYLRIEESVTWQLFQRVRGRVFGLLGGERSRNVAALQATLRFIGRVLRTGRRPTARGAVTFPRSAPASGRTTISFDHVDDPDVSIVIPLYAHADLTRAALESIQQHTREIGYEVILVDDAADPATKALLKQVQGARTIVNDPNMGYLRSVKRGVDAARGRWLVLCNNDIEVQAAWLSALVDCGESHPDIAIVAPKFLYPDGSLAEAGGIIWCDGTGANYGRGGEPNGCHYEYRREIDYGSAAALLVRRDIWHRIGGFDERFEPMYFEDTDLCFEARARGLRVMFEPRARVVHAEGATAGVDESSGHKRHQQLNRAKFVRKWSEQLQAEHLPDDHKSLWLASNLRRRPHVFVADHRVPMWDRESGALRMRGILETLARLGCHVTFLPDNLMPSQPYTRELQRIGVEVLYGIDVPGDLAQIFPSASLVILSRPEVAVRWLGLVREHAPEATVMYDTVDLHWLREARRAAVEDGAQADELVHSAKADAFREMELGLVRATDATIVVTDDERARVEEDVPEAVVHVLPNVNQGRAYVPPPTGRQGLLFVGGFEHPPNVDGARALVQDVMPLVWAELGEVHVTIVGSDPPPEIEALASPLVAVSGWVPDLDPLIDSSLALAAPLSYGAGLKGKVTQAMAAGLPVVTTPVGAEGLDAIDGEHLLIGETPEELAERIVRVALDAQLWMRLSHNGQQRAAERCSPEVFTERLEQLLRDTRRASVTKS